jgi:hypothetical protein
MVSRERGLPRPHTDGSSPDLFAGLDELEDAAFGSDNEKVSSSSIPVEL